MASGNKGMTMAKRNRENKLRERRLDKQARKEARKLASRSDDLGLAPDATPGGTDAVELGEAAREMADQRVDA